MWENKIQGDAFCICVEIFNILKKEGIKDTVKCTYGEYIEIETILGTTVMYSFNKEEEHIRISVSAKKRVMETYYIHADLKYQDFTFWQIENMIEPAYNAILDKLNRLKVKE